MVSRARLGCAAGVAGCARRVCFRRCSRGSPGIDSGLSVPFDSARGKKVVLMITPALTELATVACLFFIFLTPLAAAGLALINAGLGRSHSAAHIMMA